MIIAVASTKGGTGKTTAALQVALYLLVQKKAKVCLVDADVQGSSNLAIQSREKNLVSPKLRTEVITDGGEILTRVPKLNEKYEYVVIDVGGRETDALRASMAICDTLSFRAVRLGSTCSLSRLISAMSFRRLVKRLARSSRPSSSSPRRIPA